MYLEKLTMRTEMRTETMRTKTMRKKLVVAYLEKVLSFHIETYEFFQ